MITSYNKILKISIIMPETWKIQQINEKQLQIVSPPHKTLNNYQARISYTQGIVDTNTENWFEDAIRSSEAQQRQVYHNYQLIKEERFWLGQHPAYLRQFQWCYEGDNVYLVNLQALISVENSAENTNFYVVKAETLQAIAETTIPIFEEIIKSTRIL